VVFALGKFPRMKIDRPGAAIIGGVFRIGLPVTVATLLFGALWLWLIR
jgi:hypothetical protein